VLTAGAGGAVGVDPNVVVVDDDLTVVLELGHHLDQGEGGVPSVGGVERGEADESMGTGFAAGVAVGKGATELDRRVFDSGFLAVGGVQNLRFEVAAIGPPQIHAGQHVGEVLGVDPTLAGMDDENRVRGVVGTGEGRGEFEGIDLFGQRAGFARDLPGEIGIVLGERGQIDEIVGLLDRLAPIAGPGAQLTQTPHDDLRRGRIVPKRGVGALPFEVVYLAFDVG
jgi:hypothetical protein